MNSAGEDINELKKRLRGYSRGDIEFNEPHFTHQMLLREGNREDVIKNLLEPESLVYSYQERGRHGDIKHCLHFKISNTRTMRLLVIFDKGKGKSLYILTYIMRHRHWQNMIRGKKR